MRVNQVSTRTLSFFVAGYPDIDPNIVYPAKDLVCSGHVVSKNVGGVINEAEGTYGEPVEVEIEEIDWKEIKRDYNIIGNRLRLYGKTQYAYVFSNGEEKFEIATQKMMTEYIKKTVEMRLTYRLDCVYGNYLNLKVLEGLRKSYEKERNITLEEGDLLCLSPTQMDYLQKEIPHADLIRYYNADNGGNMFVYYGEPKWKIVNERIQIFYE